MTQPDNRRRTLGWLAIVFGVLTTISGASVLLGPEALQAAAGDVVRPILWFNALTGPVYVLAGAGILASRPWGRQLARLLAVAIATMLLYLVARILGGTPWEPRTLLAMIFRLAVWTAIARLAPAAGQPHRPA